jgi:hypothetical protein
VIHGDPTSGEGATALAEIRVTANRRQLSSDTEGAGPSPSVPAVTPEEEATDPIDQQEAYRQAVLDYIPPTKDDLLFELDEPDRATRVAAVPKVGMLPPRAAIEVVSHVFANDDDATVRSRAVAALTRLDGPGARGLLRARALGDDDPGLRMQALNALASSRGERAVNVLGRALRHDPELRVRISAIRALGRVGGDWARRSLERARHPRFRSRDQPRRRAGPRRQTRTCEVSDHRQLLARHGVYAQMWARRQEAPAA